MLQILYNVKLFHLASKPVGGDVFSCSLREISSFSSSTVIGEITHHDFLCVNIYILYPCRSFSFILYFFKCHCSLECGIDYWYCCWSSSHNNDMDRTDIDF